MTLLSIVVAALALVGDPAQDRPAQPPLARSLAAIAAAEKAMVSLDLKKTDVQTVIEKLNALGIVQIRADWPALERIEIDHDDTLDFVVHDISLLDAMTVLSQTLGRETERAVVDAGPGQIVLTTELSAASLRETAVYDVADIATDPTLLARDDTANVTASGSSAAATSGSLTASDETLPERMERLVELLTDHVDTSSWFDNGGSRGKISTEAARLIVTATPYTHRKLRAMLADIRRESPLAAQIGVTLFEIPRSSMDELLHAAHGDGSELANLIQHHDAARRAWSPRVVVRLGEEASVRSDGDASHESCILVARHDRIERGLALTLDFEVARGPARAAFKGTIPFENGLGTIATVLPGGPDESHGWILVVDAAEANRS